MSGRRRIAVKPKNGIAKRTKVTLSKEHILPRSFTAKGREVKVEVERNGKKRALSKPLVEISPSKKFGDQINSPKKQVVIFNQIKRALKNEGMQIPMVSTCRLTHSMGVADSLLVTKLDIVPRSEFVRLSKPEFQDYHKKIVLISKILGRLGWIVPMGSFVPVKNASGRVEPVLADFKNIIKI